MDMGDHLFCSCFFYILFAWFGMIDFLLPLGIAVFGGNKFYCNHLCGKDASR